MLITLIGHESINKIVLPKLIVGNYWIGNEKNSKIINIEGKNGQWKIINNNNINVKKFMGIKNQQNEELNDEILIDYNSYFITNEKNKETYILHCAPVYEKFTHLKLNHHTRITIGRGRNNDIVYNNKFVSDNHAQIVFSNGRCIIENLDKKFGTFVNSSIVYRTSRVLLNGDVIFIMGLKIIIMGNSIYINNPLNNVTCNPQCFSIIESERKIENLSLENENELEEDFNDNYFSRSPRITNKIECEKVRIDPPPIAQGNDSMPAFLMIGSTLTMGIMMFFSMSNSISGIINGNASTYEIIVSFLMTFAFLISMILLPIVQLKYQKKQKKEYEKKRQKRYRDYINSKIRDIDRIMENQRNILSENYVNSEECSNIILLNKSRLWERKIEDYDFLRLRLGTGDVPLNIDIQYPEKQFTMEDDDLVDILNEVANKSKILKNAPIVLSFVEKNISAVISKDEEEQKRFVKSLILQLITFHSFEDLKIIFLLKKDKQKRWEHLKMLPHVWNNKKDIRLFTDEYDEMKEISSYLEKIIQERKANDAADYKSFSPYYFIITDDYKKIENLKAITEIIESKRNIGFSVLCMADNLMQLPNECQTFIEIDEGKGAIFESEMLPESQVKFMYDKTQRLFFEKIAQTISNIPINYNTSKEMLLPNSYTFLEMYDVGLIEQLNVLERWKKNDPTLSLRAPIGIDTAGMRIDLDIHEKFHGPHGLIAGSTGSGKSEFIITYILSLAINYHPDDLAFILIDYKGGGLAGAFKKGKISLPHLVGTITNIDTAGLQRSLASIQSELRRRQIMFNEARNMTNEGTIDIYKYQKLYHEGVVNKPIPHLLIICDEFAELKQQQEEFMDELISVARIGRSLGVHLILATQKPAGIVNDQIRSNSKFAICLKVQDREDSMDVIKRPDAANLKNAGQFFMQVGNNEYFALGQSAWSGAPYYPANTAKKKVDNSIDIISNIGTIIKKIDDSVQDVSVSKGEQLTNIVKYIYELAKSENIKEKQLWLENIPENIYIDAIREKYKLKFKENTIAPVIGEYDDPFNQRQGAYYLNLTEDGNTIIYGSADSGKEALLSTIVYDIMTTYSTQEVEMYLLDFGSEALKIFKKCPHVGDVAFLDDIEKISRFFDMIQKEIKNRKAILSDYNGDYNLYLKTNKNTMPMIIVVINNYEAFSEGFNDKYDDILLSITREGIKCGIVFIVTASSYNSIRYRLNQNFKQKIALQLNNDDDYFNIFDDVGKKRPSHLFGRGLISLGPGQVYEFQTAKICEPEQWSLHISSKIEEVQKINKNIAKSIPVLPNRVLIEDIEDELSDLTKVPLGIKKKELTVYTYNFTKNVVNIITAKNLEEVSQFTSYIIEELRLLKNINLMILDFEKAILNKKTTQGDFKNCIEQIKNNSSNNICIVIGIDKLISDVQNGEQSLLEMIKIADESESCNFIFVDNSSRLKNHEYDEWYKSYVSGDTGIWVGNGIDDQYLIKTNTIGKDIVNKCGISFGYVVNQGEATMIKLLGIKEDGDKNE